MGSGDTAVRKASRLPRVLVVDDEEAFHRTVGRYLDDVALFRAFSGAQALAALTEHTIDVVLLDLGLPDKSGLSVLADILKGWPDLPVMIVTASQDIRTAVEAVKAGAFDFFTKRHENYAALRLHIGRALELGEWRRQKRALSSPKDWHGEAFRLLENTTSTDLRESVRVAKKIAPSPLSVLIEGPTGSGKEIMARYVHASSDRSTEPFVAVHVGALPETLLESQLFGHVKGAFTGAVHDHIGKFESAGHGTLFLDEVGDISPHAQVALLRVLQEREVEQIGGTRARPIHCRIVCATNKDLHREVQSGRFREDLYFRLCGVRLKLPGLASRPGDIPALVNMLIDKAARRLGQKAPTIEPEALQVLGNYPFPGNIRELENLVMRLVVMASESKIARDAIPPEVWLPTLHAKAQKRAEDSSAEGRLYFLAREQFERYLVQTMVARCHGNKREAARRLGVSYSTVKDKTRERYED